MSSKKSLWWIKAVESSHQYKHDFAFQPSTKWPPLGSFIGWQIITWTVKTGEQQHDWSRQSHDRLGRRVNKHLFSVSKLVVTEQLKRQSIHMYKATLRSVVNFWASRKTLLTVEKYNLKITETSDTAARTTWCRCYRGKMRCRLPVKQNAL